MCRKKEQKDYRTELEKNGVSQYFTMTDGTKVRVLDFNLAENKNEYAILLVPGFLTVFQSWQRVMELLTKEFRVYYLESREKPSSVVPKKLERKITLRVMAHDIKEVVEQMDLDKQKYIALASSTGGHILTEALSEKWLNPAGVVMVGPAIQFYIQWYVAMLSATTPHFLIKGFFRPLVKWWISLFYVNKKAEPEQLDKYMRALDEGELRKALPLLRRFHRYKRWDLPPKVEAKTLLLGASKDKMHDTKQCLRVHELMPNSKYVDLGSNKATHDKPLVDEIKVFLKELNKK